MNTHTETARHRLPSRTANQAGGRTRQDQEILESLPMGALRLDGEGRILEYRPLFDAFDERDWLGVVGLDLFHDVLRATSLEHTLHTFRRGVVRRDMHEAWRLQLRSQGRVVYVDLLLFYHAGTGEAWGFLEPVFVDEPMSLEEYRRQREREAQESDPREAA